MDLYALTTQETLDRIARHCPRALPAYISCLYRADNDGQVFLSKRAITHDLSESYVKFRNNIKLLALENLLEWHEIDNGLHITLILPQVDE